MQTAKDYGCKMLIYKQLKTNCMRVAFDIGQSDLWELIMMLYVIINETQITEMKSMVRVIPSMFVFIDRIAFVSYCPKMKMIPHPYHFQQLQNDFVYKRRQG